MLYTVAEVSDLTNLSKVSVYKKLKSKELEPHIIKRKNTTYVTEDGLNLIKSGLKDNIDGLNELNNKNIEEELNVDDAEVKEDLNINKELINTLLEQLKEKDVQIKDLNDRLKNEQELHRNTQVMLNNKQEPKLLEDHFRELDLKLINIRENMQQRKDKKGLFKSLFKK